MISSEQTEARIGRRMKTSEVKLSDPFRQRRRAPPRPAPAAPAPSTITGAPSPIFCTPGDDQLFAGFSPDLTM
jgi:hypothetical protein